MRRVYSCCYRLNQPELASSLLANQSGSNRPPPLTVVPPRIFALCHVRLSSTLWPEGTASSNKPARESPPAADPSSVSSSPSINIAASGSGSAAPPSVAEFERVMELALARARAAEVEEAIRLRSARQQRENKFGTVSRTLDPPQLSMAGFLSGPSPTSNTEELSFTQTLPSASADPAFRRTPRDGDQDQNGDGGGIHTLANGSDTSNKQPNQNSTTGTATAMTPLSCTEGNGQVQQVGPKELYPSAGGLTSAGAATPAASGVPDPVIPFPERVGGIYRGHVVPDISVTGELGDGNGGEFRALCEQHTQHSGAFPGVAVGARATAPLPHLVMKSQEGFGGAEAEATAGGSDGILNSSSSMGTCKGGGNGGGGDSRITSPRRSLMPSLPFEWDPLFAFLGRGSSNGDEADRREAFRLWRRRLVAETILTYEYVGEGARALAVWKNSARISRSLLKASVLRARSAGALERLRDLRNSSALLRIVSGGASKAGFLRSSNGGNESGNGDGIGANGNGNGNDVGGDKQRWFDNLAAQANVLSQHLNALTGYDQVAALKAGVEARESDVSVAHSALVAQKRTYDAKLQESSRVSRELHLLLQRKAGWSENDVSAFLRLTREEHALEAAVAQEKELYDRRLDELESSHARLLAATRERYGVEQLWSDKIRRLSTWWTSGLVALNMLSFLTVYVFLEPLKIERLRLVMQRAVADEADGLRDYIASTATATAAAAAAAAVAAISNDSQTSLVSSDPCVQGGPIVSATPDALPASLSLALADTVREVGGAVPASAVPLYSSNNKGPAPHSGPDNPAVTHTTAKPAATETQAVTKEAATIAAGGSAVATLSPREMVALAAAAAAAATRQAAAGQKEFIPEHAQGVAAAVAALRKEAEATGIADAAVLPPTPAASEVLAIPSRDLLRAIESLNETVRRLEGRLDEQERRQEERERRSTSRWVREWLWRLWQRAAAAGTLTRRLIQPKPNRAPSPSPSS